MLDQYFGIKELHEVVLRAKTPMTFGSRQLEADEPVLYFKNVSMSVLREPNRAIMARGGWANMPRVIWDQRSEVEFVLSEGVLSSVSMGIVLGCNVAQAAATEPVYVHKVTDPLTAVVDEDSGNIVVQIDDMHEPVLYPVKKGFVFEYYGDVIQNKLYGRVEGRRDKLGRSIVSLWKDKNFEIPADKGKEYIVDYYYKYDDTALLYKMQKERFNGLFTLEGKFYSKDENEGLDYTNLLYMPKVRVVSDINLRLGERADPTVGTFNIIGLPESSNDSKSLILEIIRLNSDEN